MSPLPRILLSSAPFFILSSLWAQTVNDFEGSGGTPYILSGFANIKSGGPTGSYVELLGNGTSQTGHIFFDRTQTGSYANVNTSFDFRTGAVANSAVADGISLVFLPTSAYGTTGTGNINLLEEPNLAGALAVGFDFYDSINEISVHWDGRAVMQGNLGNNSVLENGSFNRLRIETEQIGNAANLIVTHTHSNEIALVTPTVLYRGAIPGYSPYENRLQLGGRTGGATMFAEVDNINSNQTGTWTPLTGAVVSNKLFQDFDTVTNGNTLYMGHSTNNAVPHLVQEGGNAFIRLTQNDINNSSSRIAFDRAYDGGVGSSNSLTFDFRAGKAGAGGTPADGMNVAFLPTAVQGNTGNGINGSVDNPSYPAGILSVSFDTYFNSTTDNGATNSVSLHLGNQTISTHSADGLVNFTDNQWKNAKITTQSVAGGANVTVEVGGTKIVDNQFVAGFVPYDYRVQFNANTGGSNENFDVDNIVSGRAQIANTPGILTQNFEGGGSEYKVYDRSAQTTTLQKNHAVILNEGGNQFMRLVHDVNNQNAFMGFDRFVRDPNMGSDTLNASFDFRMVGGTGADGFAFGLFDVGVHGTTGDHNVTMNPNWESIENLPGALLFGFDVYQKNRVKVSYNGTSQLVDINTADLNLRSDAFNRANIQLVADPNDPNNSLLTMIILDNDGSLTTVFDDYLLTGLNLSTYDFRAGFGARTGGSNINVDIDNFILMLAPEPSKTLLILGASSLLALCTRRRP